MKSTGRLIVYSLVVQAATAGAMLGIYLARREAVPASIWLADMAVTAVLAVIAAREMQ